MIDFILIDTYMKINVYFFYFNKVKSPPNIKASKLKGDSSSINSIMIHSLFHKQLSILSFSVLI